LPFSGSERPQRSVEQTKTSKKRSPIIRKIFSPRWGILGAAVLGLATLFPTASAKAGDVVVVCSYKYVTAYEWVTTYETRSVPYTKIITLKDHCGNAYMVTLTCHRDVQVAVKKLVAVQKLVPCY
jgi:hypothetical protein